MRKRIAFFGARPYDRRSFDAANKDLGFEITYFDVHLSPQSVGLSRGFDAVCAFVNDDLGKDVIDRLVDHGIQIIGLRCAGYDNVDLKAACGRIHVVRVPAYSPYAIAEHAVALMLSLNRKMHKAYQRTRDGNFSIDGLLGFDMHGKTAGIIGTGKIGRCVISILQGLGMHILAYDVYPDNEYAKRTGIAYVTLEKLYKKSDVISLHCLLTDETKYMINKAAIEQMKDGVMIINTSRGKVIHTEDLIDGIKCGKIGAVGLDVYEREKDYFFEDRSSDIIADDILARLLTFPNVLVTSHQAFFTKEALHNIAETTLSNLREFFESGRLNNEIRYQCD